MRPTPGRSWSSIPSTRSPRRCRTRADWQVIRKAGTEIRVPRKTKLSRTVGAQIPTGFDPTVWGISADMATSIDRVALWNIVATVDAFLSAGFTPTELMRWVHPSLVASTQGTGMGGMTSMQTMYHGNLLGRNKPNDILQEVLPNVVAAHVIQSYVGSYGAMIHPVGACATAAVSVEEGVDKIRLGKAELVVAGGFDDLTQEAIIGFGDMAATADTEMMRAKGISDSKFSRANDRRRLGFVESQGGGTILLARGDLAAQDGSAGAGGGRLRAELRRRCAHVDPGSGHRRARRRPRRQGLGAGPLAGQAGGGCRRHRGDLQARHLDAGQRPQRDRAARAAGRLDWAAPRARRCSWSVQKSLTGHAKGGAAVFQMMGLCQILRDGVIPPNRSLDCVDDEMASSAHFVWPRETLRLGGKFPLKAGLVTSLGFGHVSGSDRAGASAGVPRRARSRATGGLLTRAAGAGAGRTAAAGVGDRRWAADVRAAADRRFDHDAPEKRQEAAMLLDPASRLSEHGLYTR